MIAGVSVAGLMMPEAVAYAEIAGLGPGRAIMAAIAGCIAYAAIGRSRFAIVSPTSSSATILAAALAAMPMPMAAAAQRDLLATIAVGIVGLVFLGAAMLRLGNVTGFISRPVLRGFALGLAITITVKQLPAIVGVAVPGSDILAVLSGLGNAIPQWHFASIATGAVALALLILLRRWPALPGAFVVLLLGIVLSVLLDLPGKGVATVGMIDIALRLPSGAMPSFETLSRLAQFALPLGLILFAESWGTIRTLALREGDAPSPNRELAALGGANLASALVQGMPVGAGFSAGNANAGAGARTRAAGLIAALGLGALIAFGRPFITALPHPVLAAVVIAALTHALNPAPLVRLWRLDRDQYVAIAATIAVLALGVLNGMLAAIVLSLAALLHRLATPQIVTLGRIGGSHDFVDISRHPDAVAPPACLIVRPAEPLFFANAERVLQRAQEMLHGRPDASALILSMEESFDLDSTAAEALIEFARRLDALKVRLRLARLHDRARDILAAAGAPALAQDASFSVADAVAALDGEKKDA